MNMQEINAKVLSNGMTRLEWFKKLDIGQNPVPCEGHFRKILDVPFGSDSDRQKYDVYMPMEPGVYPTIFRIHGGGWFTGHRSDKNMARYAKFAEHGYVVISIGYRQRGCVPRPCGGRVERHPAGTGARVGIRN